MFVVLGCHRSGTSVVAGILQSSGIHMGNPLPPAQDNPSGFFEDQYLVAINSQLLKRSGADWENPTVVHSMPEDVEQIAREVVRRTEGLKDPRLCFTIRAWEPLLEDVKFIVLRRPYECIAASLKARGDNVDGYALAQKYDRAIQDFLLETDSPAHYILYDDILDNTEETMFALSEFIDRPVIIDIIDVELRHHEDS